MVLRPYQQRAVEAIYEHLRTRDDNPCAVLPTAAGKTPVIAHICRDAVNLWDGRVLVIAHVKELLEQTVDKLMIMAPELALQIGVYSAGLGRRDTDHPILVAGIQSIYKRACDLGRFDLVIIDEAHMIPTGSEGDGMYRQLVADMKVINPDMRVIGLTATPFRLKHGPICVPPPEGVLNHICYEVSVKELIVDGYLSKLRTKAGVTKPDFQGLHVRGGEFIAGEAEDLMDDDALVRGACEEIVAQTQDRHAVLIFTTGVRHGRHVAETIASISNQTCGFVDADTPARERREVLTRFKQGDLKYLANVNVLTTGFDAPNVDCVALLRPTMSPGLYYQMVGRGFRLHPGKADCLVLDYGGNVLRHGPVDALQLTTDDRGDGEAPVKECPECHELVPAGCSTCPACGHTFPPRKTSNHEVQASDAAILSGEITETRYDVRQIFFSVHTKRDAPPEAPRTMRVEYEVGFHQFQSEWICVEHPMGSFPWSKAQQWWQRRSSLPMPATAEEAVALADEGALADTLAITVRSVSGEKFDRIVDYDLAEVPDVTGHSGGDSDDSDLVYEPALDEVPF